MAGFEDLIRGALNKQGRPTPERREAIYASSRKALERMLANKTSLDENAAKAQRERLEQAITEIEKDYVLPDVTPTVSEAAEPPVLAPDPGPAPVTVPDVQPSVSVTPEVRPEEKLVPEQPRAESDTEKPYRIEPEFEAPGVPSPPEPEAVHKLQPEVDDVSDEYQGDLLNERKPYAKMLLWTIILVGIGVALWWAVTFGPGFIKERLDGSVPNPDRSIESGSFVPDADEGWINLFQPKEDATNIDSANQGTVELFQEGSRNFVRLTSNAGGRNNTLRVKVPRGVIEPLRGKAATFELMVRNASPEEHEFAVFCEFEAMGSCGRVRFKARNQLESFIFDMLVNDTVLDADTDAYVALNTDLGGSGRAIDVFSIKVRTGQ